MSSNINIRTFTGAGIKTYVPSMAKLRIEVFKGYPFLSTISLEDEMAYLRKFIQHKDAIAILVFDGPKIVGVSIGAPFEMQEADLLRPFQEKGLNPASYFYFGQSTLLEPYRGRGVGHHFFDIREQHAKNLKKFTAICFISIVRLPHHPLASPDHSSISIFWEKRGYVKRPDLIYYKSWKDINEPKESTKTLMFWTKDLA